MFPIELERSRSGTRLVATVHPQPRPVFFSRIKTRDAPGRPGQTQKPAERAPWWRLRNGKA